MAVEEGLWFAPRAALLLKEYLPKTIMMHSARQPRQQRREERRFDQSVDLERLVAEEILAVGSRQLAECEPARLIIEHEGEQRAALRVRVLARVARIERLVVFLSWDGVDELD